MTCTDNIKVKGTYIYDPYINGLVQVRLKGNYLIPLDKTAVYRVFDNYIKLIKRIKKAL